MAKEYQFKWQPAVSAELQRGAKFDRFDEDAGLFEPNCTFQVDEYAFYLHWRCEGKDAQVLDFTQIFEVRIGVLPVDPRILGQLELRCAREGLEERCIFVTSGVDLVNVNSFQMLAQDVDTARTWRADLRTLLRNRRIGHCSPWTCLMKHWKMLCLTVNENGKIPSKSITRTFASGRTERMVLKCLMDLGLDESQGGIDPDAFTFENFYSLCQKICPRTDVQELFAQLAGGGDSLSVQQLISFLNERQRNPQLNEILFPFFDSPRVKQLIAKYEQDDSLAKSDRMGLDGFTRYLISDENAPVFLDRVELFQDMDQPLCHYLINSSHNTYLIGRQYGGRSSVDIYRQVLIAGCRCVELDCWDSTTGAKDEPIITHGKAMCTDVLFKDVIVAIAETAFLASDYPVILSFENHCSRSNQLKMAKYCMDTFGDLLLGAPIDAVALEAGVALPSPNQLKRKVLIKNKRLFAEVERHQLEQFLREGRLDEDDAASAADANAEDPQVIVIGEDGPLENSSKREMLAMSEAAAAEDEDEDSGDDAAAHISNERKRATASRSSGCVAPAKPPTNAAAIVACSPRMKTVAASGMELVRKKHSAPSLRHGELLPSILPTDSEAHPELKSGTQAGTAFKSRLKQFGSKITASNPKEPLCYQSSLTLSSVASSPKLLSPTRSFRVRSKKKQHPTVHRTGSFGQLDDGYSNPTLTKEQELELLQSYQYTGATTNIHPLLSSLVNYTHPVKFQGFDVAELNNIHFHMSSFSESTGLGYLKQSALEFVNYNKRQLSRIYPKGGRVDSSNFLPQIFWNAGCQMVALNFQTPDLAMQLNQGRFEYNGSCGYLLKPDFMRRPDRMFDPFAESPVDGVIAAYCAVRVISGQFLSDRKIGTFCEVEMYGLPTDTIRKEFRTRIVPANGLNPFYNEQPFVFRKVVLPELAVLRFAVCDENGKLLGQRILPLEGLQAGYRHISLRTETNFPMTLPTLFCHIILRTYVPEGLGDLVDALADPKGWLSQMDKRQQQMEAMGINEEDIGDVPQRKLQGGKGSNASTATNGALRQDTVGSSSSGGQPSTPQGHSVVQSQMSQSSGGGRDPSSTSAAAAAAAADDKFRVEPVVIDDLRTDKGVLKLTKKHSRDLDDLRKRQLKERNQVQKQQVLNVEKIVGEPPDDAANSKQRRQAKHASSRRLFSPRRFGSFTTNNFSAPVLRDEGGSDPGAPSNDKVRSLVVHQTREWSELVRRHQDQEHDLRKVQIGELWESLRKLLADAHRQQLASLKQQLDVEKKELLSQQSKRSMEDSKMIQQDKNIKTRTEKERRVKELNSKNLKVFMDERKRLTLRHQKHEDQLSKKQVEQKQQLEKDARAEQEANEMCHQESLLAAKPETLC